MGIFILKRNTSPFGPEGQSPSIDKLLPLVIKKASSSTNQRSSADLHKKEIHGKGLLT